MLEEAGGGLRVSVQKGVIRCYKRIVARACLGGAWDKGGCEKD